MRNDLPSTLICNRYLDQFFVECVVFLTCVGDLKTSDFCADCEANRFENCRHKVCCSREFDCTTAESLLEIVDRHYDHKFSLFITKRATHKLSKRKLEETIFTLDYHDRLDYDRFVEFAKCYNSVSKPRDNTVGCDIQQEHKEVLDSKNDSMC